VKIQNVPTEHLLLQLRMLLQYGKWEEASVVADEILDRHLAQQLCLGR
jgi:hypothetical protein